MILDKSHLICFLVGVILGGACCFFSAKEIYDRPIEESVKHDTITVHDTIPDLLPTPKDSTQTKWLVKWFPLYKHTTDTLEEVKFLHDSVLVEIPITQKHYGNETYDAWVSGHDPSLDSIKVYQKTEYITTTITKEKQQGKLSLNVRAGADYFTGISELYPYAKGNLEYNISKSPFYLCVEGGVYKADKVQPFAGAYMKLKIF